MIATIPAPVQALIGDARRLAALHAAAFPAAWSEADMAAFLAQSGIVAFMAPPGDPQGFVMARLAADEAEILTLAVTQAARRKGLARALVTALAGALARRGAARLHLEVAADNAPALALYAACGFAQTGRRTGYYAAGRREAADALTMTLALRPAMPGGSGLQAPENPI